MNECIFCKIVKGEIPCFKVYEDEKVLAFGDINPVAKGHTLIIPKKHAENLWEITAEDLSAKDGVIPVEQWPYLIDPDACRTDHRGEFRR